MNPGRRGDTFLNTLRQTDLRTAVGFLDDLGEDDDVRRFLANATAGVARLVASDLTTLSVCDLRAGKRYVFASPVDAISRADRERFDRYIYEHPLVRFHSQHPEGGSRKISDSVPLGAFRDTGLYSEYYRPIGINYVMAVPMVAQQQTVISLVLNRSSSDFDEHDRQILDLVRPGMAHLYRCAVAREEARQAVARLREMTIEQGGAVLVLDRDRRLRDASERAARTWRKYFPGERLEIGGRLPGRVDAWLDCLPGPEVLSAASLPALKVTRDGVTLAISAVVDHVREECYLLLLERMPALSVDRLLALPLTPREREVLVWVAAGKTNAEIAAIICARPRTVQKHLERIFIKLGVETRTAAVARAFGLSAAMLAGNATADDA